MLWRERLAAQNNNPSSLPVFWQRTKMPIASMMWPWQRFLVVRLLI